MRYNGASIVSSIATILIASFLIFNKVYPDKSISYVSDENCYYKPVGFISEDSDGNFEVNYISNISSVESFINECTNNGYTGTVYKLDSGKRRFGVDNTDMRYHVFYISDGENIHYGVVDRSINKFEGEEVKWATN